MFALSLSRLTCKSVNPTLSLIRSMSTQTPPNRPFRLALIQMGGISSDKTKNLAHAKELIIKASNPNDGDKPGVIVLPVLHFYHALCRRLNYDDRNVSTRHTDMSTSPTMPKLLVLYLVKTMMSQIPKARVLKCCLRQPGKLEPG